MPKCRVLRFYKKKILEIVKHFLFVDKKSLVLFSASWKLWKQWYRHLPWYVGIFEYSTWNLILRSITSKPFYLPYWMFFLHRERTNEIQWKSFDFRSGHVSDDKSVQCLCCCDFAWIKVFRFNRRQGTVTKFLTLSPPTRQFECLLRKAILDICSLLPTSCIPQIVANL